MSSIRLVLVLALVTTTVVRVRTQGSSPSAADTARAQAFLGQLQHAVDASDRKVVSRLFRYPATVLASGFNIPVANTDEMLRLYDLVFNPELRCAIAWTGFVRNGTPRPRHPIGLQADGLSIAGGLVWAQKSGTDFRIARVTVPPSVSYQHAQEPRRVRFPEGQRGEKSVQYYNWLQRDDLDAYVLTARKGQLLQARIEGFQGSDATLRVIEAGAAASDPGREAARTWSRYLTATGEYRIEVIRLAPYCDPALLYRLFITLR